MRKRSKTDLQTGYSHRQRRKSLNNCLAILGAPIKDIYANPKLYGSHGQHKPVGGSIYNRYSMAELWQMLRWHYLSAAKRYHPDRYSVSENRMKEINWAYETGIKLLRARCKPEEWVY